MPSVSQATSQPDINRIARPVAPSQADPNPKDTVSIDPGNGTRPTFFQQAKAVVRDVAGTGADLGNTAFGVDPNLSTLTGLQMASNAFGAISFIPHDCMDFFTKYAFPAFRVGAPVLDTIKLTNTWKMSKAMGQLKDPKATGLNAVLKSGNILNVVTDALHLGLDVACSAAILGAALHLPFLAIMAVPLAINLGFCGDIAAGAVHGAGAVANLSDPTNGATFSTRWKKLINTQSGTALVKRVFQNEEPLLDQPNGPVTPPDNTDDSAQAAKK